MSGKTLEELAEAVANIRRSNLSEAKSFAKPPQMMLDTLTATMLLLGEVNPTWDTIKYNMTRGDGKGLTNLVVEYDPSEVSDATKTKAKDLLSKHTLQDLRKCSVFTAIVFEWAVAAVDA
ncbi:uncharacterized protein LOC127862996 [Dreissena polymorpha]|uniref:Uncharacterized protein n=1 Tax=Dreissena polymorpha TaxID=45954 RepID=A0A9D3YDL9_DREPO|nr:uncharacterized protein LOC127862996 [Dreissena polymorpha]XP_052258271.1 uncharacterized protein LOC127862996 [Dreissena polymorpha]KAH3698450.1 hypothetical protein DPMN_085971 [Dreissena polymorpha]